MLRYLWYEATFASAVDQRRAVHAIAQGGGAEPNAPTCEFERSAYNIAQPDFNRLGARCSRGRTGYISGASIISPWRFHRFWGPCLQDGGINGGRMPETYVPADDYRHTDADEDKNHGSASRSVYTHI
jgi:hypothetical protein